jgi:[amino group carrier protein]-lysine/ornithine hydrolase
MLDPSTLLEAMVAIPSPSGRESALAGFLADQVARQGVPVEVDAAGNVVLEVGTGSGPTVLGLGHLDTIDDPRPARRHGRLLYGRGSVDAKAALAAMICAALALPEFPGRLIVAGAVEEETPGSRGATHLLTYLRPDAVLIGEPSGWDRITIGYKGHIVVEVDLSVPGSHASHPDEKAPEAAARIWRAIAGRFPRDPEGPIFDRVVASAQSIHADFGTAGMVLDLRIPPGLDPARLVGQLSELTKVAAGGSARVRLVAHVPGNRQDRTNPVVGSLAAAIDGQGGRARHVLKGGTSDLNIIAPQWSVPMAAYGPGDSTLDHTPDEHVDLDEYLRSVRVLTAALPRLARRLAPAIPTVGAHR